MHLWTTGGQENTCGVACCRQPVFAGHTFQADASPKGMGFSKRSKEKKLSTAAFLRYFYGPFPALL